MGTIHGDSFVEADDLDLSNPKMNPKSLTSENLYQYQPNTSGKDSNLIKDSFESSGVNLQKTYAPVQAQESTREHIEVTANSFEESEPLKKFSLNESHV